MKQGDSTFAELTQLLGLTHRATFQKNYLNPAKEAGLIMTGAGATFPYGKDPKDSNIRIAPSFPTVEELAQAAEIFVLSVKLVSVEKLLGAK